MGHQNRLAQPGRNGRRRMAHMHQKGTPSDARAVYPLWSDAQIIGQHHGALPGCGDAINVLGTKPRILQRVQRRIGVQAQFGQIGDFPHIVRLGGSDNRQKRFGHWPASGAKNGRVISSFWATNLTLSGMSRISASGVWSHSTMLVIMVGPSSNCTTAIA